MSSDDNNFTKTRSALSPRRIVLLATTVLGLGAAALIVVPNAPQFGSAALAENVTQQAQTVQRPVGFADIVEKVKPAVISVRVRMDEGASRQNSSDDDSSPFPQGSPMERFFRQFGMPNGQQFNGRMPRGGRRYVTGQGSGFFISADGYAVTNNHVVENADKVEVKTDDGKTYDAKVVGTDPRTDLALIKVDGGSDFPYAKLATSSARIGDWVLAVGNPFGLGGTVTAGIVSARGRDIGAGAYDDFIQIDAPVNKGNSGGPTFDVDGNVIGVNTAIYSPSGGSVGIAFAIPADTVKTVIAQLKDSGVVTRGWIGVQIQPVTQDIADSLGMKTAEGALVADPQENGPAVKAGIKAGDVIIKVNGDAVKDARDLAKKIGGIPPNTTVHLTIVRGGSEKVVDLTTGTMPKQQDASNKPNNDDRGAKENTSLAHLGVTLAPTDDGSQGVAVAEVDPSGVAADHGIKAGDVIVEVAGKAVSKPGEVREALATAEKGGHRTVLLRVKTGDATRFIAVPVGRG